MLRRLLLATAGLLAAALPNVAAQAQSTRPDARTIVLLREIDSDRYDPHRTTSRAAGEAVYMLSDTLVTLDWDLKTVKPGLAESWTVSDDGKLYTFKLKPGVTFCDGKPFTAEDVVYSVNRWIGRTEPKVTSPVAWRAGPVKEVRAKDPLTVEYELNAPFSELLYQLSLFFGSIVDRATVERLGDDFGVRGFNGTGPFCWQAWSPRNEFVLTRHPTYKWGPPIYANQGPALVERVVWKIVPDQNTRIAALQTGQGDATQYPPLPMLAALKATPGITVSEQPNYLWDFFVGFKVDKPVMNDPRVRRALVMAVDREAIVEAVFMGTAEPATTLINPAALDFYPGSKEATATFDAAGARKLLDEAGWVPGPDGIRVKAGEKLSFLTYGLSTQVARQYLEAIQADLRKVGVDMRIQLWDATIGWGKLATQEFDAFTMSYPYVSAGDALNLYFRSGNAPTPNRMNWKDPETDRLLAAGQTALTVAQRAEAYAAVQRKLEEASVWLPIAREKLFVVSNNRISGARAHGIYGVGLYKGLDLKVGR